MPTLLHLQPLGLSFLSTTRRSDSLLALFHTMSWFHPRDWYQKEITFPGDPAVTWALEEKLSERFNQRTEGRSLAPHDPSAAWAVFLCKRKDGQGEKHAMKIWIQYDTSLYLWTLQLIIQNPLYRHGVYIQPSPEVSGQKPSWILPRQINQSALSA